MVVADLEAGMGTMLRLGDTPLDVAVIVVEPTAKSLEVGRRLVEVAEERKVGRVVVVANRLTDDADLASVKGTVTHPDVWPVPHDPEVASSDRDGRAPMDSVPHPPAVAALSALAADVAPPGADAV